MGGCLVFVNLHTCCVGVLVVCVQIVEVPQIEWVERVVEVPEVIYNTKIVPKVEIRENIVEKPVFVQKWVEKIVEVSVVEEVIRYRTIHEPEEIIKYATHANRHQLLAAAPPAAPVTAAAAAADVQSLELLNMSNVCV